MGAIISVLKNIISTKRKDYFDHMYTDDIYEDFDKEYIVLGVDMDGPTELEVNSHRDLQYNEDEEDDLVSSYERSIDAAMNTLVGCWRVIDSNDVTNEEAIVSMMDAATRLLCSVVPAHDFRFAVDKSRRNSAVTLDFVSLTPLVEKGMRSSSLSSSWRRLSTSSSHLLSVLLASRDATRVVEVLNIPVVTDILATCYMRKYTSSMMKSTNSFASAAASTTSTHDDDDANDWFVPFCSLLQRSNERSSSSEVACNMGVVYFALRQIEK